jgi:hypothetical protein
MSAREGEAHERPLGRGFMRQKAKEQRPQRGEGDRVKLVEIEDESKARDDENTGEESRFAYHDKRSMEGRVVGAGTYSGRKSRKSSRR